MVDSDPDQPASGYGCYLQQVASIRLHAARVKSPDVREQLLLIAAMYEHLAHHVMAEARSKLPTAD